MAQAIVLMGVFMIAFPAVYATFHARDDADFYAWLARQPLKLLDLFRTTLIYVGATAVVLGLFWGLVQLILFNARP